jgi:AraC-like DNA-binding protein
VTRPRRDEGATAAGYEERPPPPRLAFYVACFWRSTTGTVAIETNVVPDACADVISRDGAPALVVGPMTSPSRIVLSPHGTVVGARFRPHVATALLGVPAGTLTDRAVDLASLGIRDLALDETLASSDAAAALRALERVLLAHLDQPPAIDRLVERAVRWLADRPSAPVGELERATGLGGRQLRRRFDAAVGLGPKTLQRVLRFQRFLVSAPGRSLASAAAIAGYLDQPHMSREIRELSGATPAQLLAASPLTPATTDFFKTLEEPRATLRA